jgi:hypothetical protein
VFKKSTIVLIYGCHKFLDLSLSFLTVPSLSFLFTTGTFSFHFQDHPLAPPDTLELTDQLLKRAAAQSSESVPMLQADKLDIIDLVFNLSAYHHPDNINLPAG